jgi:hypothetical protein
MKTTIKINRFLCQCLVIFFCLFAMYGVAHANNVYVDKFASFLDALGPANPYASDGITGNSVREAESLFTCLDQGNDALVCIDQTKNTQLGHKLTEEEDIPSWGWYLLDSYVAMKEGDVWYFIEKLGLSVVCAVMNFFTDVDVCGLIEELVAAAQDVVQAAEEIYGWFEDVGEALWDAATGALCYLSVCCCDDPPPPPPAEDLAYAEFFAPKVSSLEGLKDIEKTSDGVYNDLRNIQYNYASGKYGAYAAFVAEKRFDDAMDAQWTSDITSNVLPDLSVKRAAYVNPQQLAALAQQNWADEWPLIPSNTVPFLCQQNFQTTFGYAHVDRWISDWKHPQHKDMAASLNLKNNMQWCIDIFWNNNKQKFGAIFLNLVQAKCPETNGQLLCSTSDDLDRCKTFMKDFGQDGQCAYTAESALQGKCPLSVVMKTRLCTSPDDYMFCLKTLNYFNQQNSCSFTIAAAQQAGDIIASAFKANGSTISCDIKAGNEAGKPVDFVCKRPRQEKNCRLINGQKFPTGTKPLVNCAPYYDPAYDTLKNSVKQVIDGLNAKYNHVFVIGDDSTDPLYTFTQTKVPVSAKLQTDIAQNFGFASPSTKPGFFIVKSGEPLPPIPFDGLSTPMAGIVTKFDSSVLKPVITGVNMEQQLQGILSSGGKPGIDPITQSSLDKEKYMETSGSANIGGASLKNQVSGTQKNMLASGNNEGQSLKGMGAQLGAQEEMKTTNGTLPAGTKIGPALEGAPAPSTPFSATLLPDITCAGQVRIANVPSSWGETITINANQATSKNRNNSGLCEFPVEYTVRNAGNFIAGSFRSLWTNGAVSGNWNHAWGQIAVNGAETGNDLIPLKPGSNKLKLVLDDLQEIKESNEANNEFHITINVTGNCGSFALTAPIVGPSGSPPPSTKQLQRR